MTSNPDKQLPEVRAAIWRYIENTSIEHALSVMDTVLVVRQSVPDCEIPDKDLALLIGALATAAGRSVHFDSNNTPTKSDPSQRVG